MYYGSGMQGNIQTKQDMQELKKFTDSDQETEICNFISCH